MFCFVLIFMDFKCKPRWESSLGNRPSSCSFHPLPKLTTFPNPTLNHQNLLTNPALKNQFGFWMYSVKVLAS